MKFEALVMTVDTVDNHPNADRLSIVKLSGYSYKIISGKLEDGSHRYKPGDLVVYVQENSIVPDYLLKQGYWDDEKGKGILAGKAGNRVKPITLRGVLSEGIMFPTEHAKNIFGKMVVSVTNDNRMCSFDEGEDVAEFLGITKWVPEIPSTMSGEVFYLGQDKVIGYDVENIKKWPAAFRDYDGPVYATEKLHGTFCGVGYIPNLDCDDAILREFFVFSKGLGSQGIVFKGNEENRNKNVYMRTVLECQLLDKLYHISDKFNHSPVYVLGEVFGRGIQDMQYGLEKPDFRGFEVYIGLPGEGYYVDAKTKYELLESVGIKTVPIFMILDKYDESKVEELTNGKSTIGDGIREGLVLVPETEQRVLDLGRLLLKSVSSDYLNRKGNTTEYQ